MIGHVPRSLLALSLVACGSGDPAQPEAAEAAPERGAPIDMAVAQPAAAPPAEAAEAPPETEPAPRADDGDYRAISFADLTLVGQDVSADDVRALDHPEQ